MNTTLTSLEGNHEATDSCKDRFRYKLVGDEGRFRFERVHFVGADGCADDRLAPLAGLIEGKWLDEIDVDEICRHECALGRTVGCPGEVARMVKEMRTFLAEMLPS